MGKRDRQDGDKPKPAQEVKRTHKWTPHAKKPYILPKNANCLGCGNEIYVRKSDGRTSWHRNPKGSPKWCPSSGNFAHRPKEK